MCAHKTVMCYCSVLNLYKQLRSVLEADVYTHRIQCLKYSVINQLFMKTTLQPIAEISFKRMGQKKFWTHAYTMCTHTYARARTHIRMCTHARVHTHTHTRTRTHTHVHTPQKVQLTAKYTQATHQHKRA